MDRHALAVHKIGGREAAVYTMVVVKSQLQLVQMGLRTICDGCVAYFSDGDAKPNPEREEDR